MLETLLCIFSSSISVKVTNPHRVSIIIDTWSGFNVIRRCAITKGWWDVVTENKNLSRLGDANGNTLQIFQELLLRVRFSNVLCRVKFLVVENLGCAVLLGTELANSHIQVIWCRKGFVEFAVSGLGSSVGPVTTKMQARL